MDVPQISTQEGTLVLINVLHSQKKINNATYNKIMEKYFNRGIVKQANKVYTIGSKLG